MSIITPDREIIYPDSDGEPMAENTLQFEYIVTIKEGVNAAFLHDANVFVAGDLFWYPVEGRPDIRTAPDTLVVFGRPRGHRLSYRQWEEAGIAPQVVFEVLSPSNRPTAMTLKFDFYERYDVEEYYIFDPDHALLKGWLRKGSALRAIKEMNGWVSPRLGVRFELVEGELHLYGAKGRRFATYVELFDQRHQAEALAEQESQRADKEKKRAEREKQRAEQERKRADELEARLRALGHDPASGSGE